jgi:hypothetical protein
MEQDKPRARVKVFTMSIEKWMYVSLPDNQWSHLNITWANDRSLHESKKYKETANQVNYFYEYRD